MARVYLLAIAFLFAWLSCGASESESVSTVDKVKAPSYVAVRYGYGSVMQTDDFIKGGNAINNYSSFAAKYVVCAKGGRWQDFAYGMPYYGIGVYVADMPGRSQDIGTPFSLYALSGATICRPSRRLSLNYEWNLGVSMNWRHYDRFTNCENEVIGSSANVHAALNFYFQWEATDRVNINLGAGFAHFSNGASKLPNRGMNVYDVFIEASYYLNKEKKKMGERAYIPPPEVKKHFEYDVIFTVSQKQIRVDTVGTELTSRFIDHDFSIYAMSGAVMYVPNYKFRVGVSIDGLYDESSGASARKETISGTNDTGVCVYKGKMRDRFSLGLSAKGELVMAGYTVFANAGYQVINGNKKDKRFYQILGIKMFLYEGLFGTFGIRSNRFSKAQHLYWSIGYTFGRDKN